VAEIKDWSTVAASNVDTLPAAGWPEGMARSDVNNVGREMMAVLRRQWDQPDWRELVSDYTVTESGGLVNIGALDATALFPVGTKVKISNAGADVYGFVTVSAFGDPDTQLTIGFWSGATSAVPATANGISAFYLGGSESLGRNAFNDDTPPFVFPDGRTAAAINAAIVSAQSTGQIVQLDAVQYDLEAAISIPAPGNVTIQGLGIGVTILVLAAGADVTMLNIADDCADVTIRDIQFNGNSVNQTAGNGIVGNDNLTRIVLHNLLFYRVWGEAVVFAATDVTPTSQSYRDCSMDGIYVQQPGGNGIRILDPNGVNRGFSVTNCAAFDPGHADGDGSSGSFAFNIDSKSVAMSNIDVVLTASTGATATGIVFGAVTSGAGGAGGGRLSQLTNFKIEGAKSDANGLSILGRYVQVSNGVVNMSGASALPLLIDGLAASPEEAGDIIVSGVQFHQGLRCQINNDAMRVSLSDCRFSNQTGVSLQSAGIDLTISNCVFDESTGDGVVLQVNGNDAVIHGCVFRDIGGDGVQIESGASRATVTGNHFDTVTGKGVDIQAGAVDTICANNTFVAVGGTDVTDAGTTSKLYPDNLLNVTDAAGENIRGPDLFIEGAAFTWTSAETVYPSFEAVVFPMGGANGSRRYRINLSLSGGAGAGTNVYDISIGPLGTIADPNARSATMPSSALVNASFLWTPAAGDKLTVSIDGTNTNPGLNFLWAYDEALTRNTYLWIRYIDG